MTTPDAPPPADRAWLPYVAPMAAFLGLTALEGYAKDWYPAAYAAKVALVTAVAWACRSTWRDLRPRPGWGTLAVAVFLGLAVTAAWVGLDTHYPKPKWLGGTRAGFSPNTLTSTWRVAFIAVRLFGLVVLVPLIEELFWRSFLMRWLIDQDFTRLPVGRVTPLAAVVTSALFASAHPEWLPALLTGLAWAALLAWSKSLSACLASHATANLALGVYVLATGAWRFW